ncbi:unnamed protein product [Lupinus luteus]|uniref:Uncharacterized protein n=1 Tax=Lupinus luteus TaxID=3873 RepID=A0AAV1VVV7_LUPLU
MEGKKQTVAVQVKVVLLIMFVIASPSLGCTPADGSGCKDCIVNQIKNDCPTCMPTLQCMARCLWNGNSRSNCVNNCNCNTAYPTLSGCKRCMSKCKCSCVN